MKTLMKFLVTSFLAILAGDIIRSTVSFVFVEEEGERKGWELQLVKRGGGEGDSYLNQLPFSLAVRISLGVSCALAASLLIWRRVKEKEAGAEEECWKCQLGRDDSPQGKGSNENLQQEGGESGSVWPLLQGPPQLRPSHELPDAASRGSYQEDDQQDSLQPSGQESPSFEEQLDSEEPASQEKSLIDNEEPNESVPLEEALDSSSDQLFHRSASLKTLNISCHTCPSLESKDIEERISTFEQRLEAVEVGLKDTEAITKMWSERIEQAEGELTSLHKQMFSILSTSPSELHEKYKTSTSEFDLHDEDNMEALKNISAIIEDTKNQDVQMMLPELNLFDRNPSPTVMGDDFNPMELPILVRLPSLESIPVKENDSMSLLRTEMPTRGCPGRSEPTCKVPTRYVSSSKRPPTAPYYEANTYVANKNKGPAKKTNAKGHGSTDLINKYTFLSSIRKRNK